MLEKKIRRYRLMDEHRKLVRTGKLQEARLILKMLSHGRVSLGLGDIEWNVERLCEELGCYICYDRRGYRATVHI